MEALIDLRVTSAKMTTDMIGALRRTLAPRFPKMEERHRFKTDVTMERGKPPESRAADQGLHGFFFKTADEREVAQFRVDGFTYNRLRPYSSWQELLPRALEAWSWYVDAASPEVVTRVALRYINRLELPLSPDVLQRHFTAPPAPAPGAPQMLVGFLTRVESRDPQSGVSCSVTQASESTDVSKLAVILDIDTFVAQEFDPRSPAIHDVLSKLRNAKNQVFFESLTDQAVRLFE